MHVAHEFLLQEQQSIMFGNDLQACICDFGHAQSCALLRHYDRLFTKRELQSNKMLLLIKLMAFV